MDEKITLHPHQEEAIEFMKEVEKDERSGGMLCLDMGLGKSFTTLGLIFDNVGKKNFTTLVIVPKTLLYNWESEFNRYQIGREPVSFKMYYRINISEQTFKENIILTTYDYIKMYEEFRQPIYHRIVLDESQNIRNYKNIISKKIYDLRSYKKWCLSGTPFYNNYSDIYAQCKFVDVEPYCNKKLWRTPSKEFLEKFREEFCFIRKKKDVKLHDDIKLPPIVHHRIDTELSERELTIYNRFKYMLNEGGNTLNYLIKIRQSCCNIKVMKKKDMECAICTSSTLNKFSCGHYLCYNCMMTNEQEREGRDIRTESRSRMLNKKCYLCHIESTKFDEIRDIIMDDMNDDEKIVIFTQWKKMGVLLKKYFKKLNKRDEEKRFKTCFINGDVSLMDRNRIMENFNTNNTKIMIATIQTCGVGVNLTRANHVILLDSWWNCSLENQAIDRLYRMGQQRKVHVYHIEMVKTIENWIEFKQRQKKIQTKILFEKKNEEYKWLGKSYGIYAGGKNATKMRSGRMYSEKMMSSLKLGTCLDRHKNYIMKRDPGYWKKINDSAIIIQRFFIRLRNRKIVAKEELDKIVPDVLSMLIVDYTYLNTVKFKKSIAL